jgi:hypothetical protein
MCFFIQISKWFWDKIWWELGLILKNHLIIYCKPVSLNMEVKNKDLNSKIALVVLSMIVVATVAGALVYSIQSIVIGDTSNIVAAEAESITDPLAVDGSEIGVNGDENGMMTLGIESKFGMGHRGGPNRMGGLRGLQVSSEFTQNVTTIAQGDSDVQNLLSQGYNITSIRPIISTIIDGNGNIATKAATANVLLEGDNGSRAFVVVDLSQAKVTKIVTLTVTEINK